MPVITKITVGTISLTDTTLIELTSHPEAVVRLAARQEIERREASR